MDGPLDFGLSQEWVASIGHGTCGDATRVRRKAIDMTAEERSPQWAWSATR